MTHLVNNSLQYKYTNHYHLVHNHHHNFYKLLMSCTLSNYRYKVYILVPRGMGNTFLDKGHDTYYLIRRSSLYIQCNYQLSLYNFYKAMYNPNKRYFHPRIILHYIGKHNYCCQGRCLLRNQYTWWLSLHILSKGFSKVYIFNRQYLRKSLEGNLVHK